MKRILEAINEGISKSLIDFDGNGNLKKQRPAQRNVKKFCFGDYVYKDSILGYNNYVGEKVAVCVSDEPGHELYAVLDHQLSKDGIGLPLAKARTDMYRDRWPEFNNGWMNTQYLRNHYAKDLKGTVFDPSILKENEYIPSKNELLLIFENCTDAQVLDAFRMISDVWTSSPSPIQEKSSNSYAVYGYFDRDGLSQHRTYCNLKRDTCHKTVIVLLNIDMPAD